MTGPGRVMIAAGLVAMAMASNAGAASAGVVPRATCQAGDKPDTALQGQVPLVDRYNGRAAQGYHCNLRVIGTHEGRVFAALDQYKSCVYAPDETWYGAGAAKTHVGLGTPTGIGVRVLDMSDPHNPVQTATLTAPIAMAPDESMTVNAKRGLLVMDSTFDSHLDVYDLKPDCRHPKLIGEFDMSPASGHAGWFAPDGKTYWMTNIFKACVTCGGSPGEMTMSSASVFPIDLTDPANPKLMGTWTEPGEGSGHNGWVSDDGKTSYACQAGHTVEGNGVVAYKAPAPGSSDVDGDKSVIATIPLDGDTCQNMQSVSYGGRPFLIAESEYTVGRALQKGPSMCARTASNPTSFAAPQIIDIADVKQPKLVSSLMLEVDDPANCYKTMNDGGDATSGTFVPGEIYDTHFCRPDRLHDPTILACAQFIAGLEVYDIRDPYHPRELGYFRPGTLGMQTVAHPDWATTPDTVDMVASPPVINAARGQIVFGSYFGGTRVVQLPKSVYPFPKSLTCENDYYFNQYNPGLCPAAKPSPRVCLNRRSVTIKVRGLAGRRVRSVVTVVNGRRLRPRRGNVRRVNVSLKGLGGGIARVTIVARLADGRTVTDRRRYRLCQPGA